MTDEDFEDINKELETILATVGAAVADCQDASWLWLIAKKRLTVTLSGNIRQNTLHIGNE